MNAFVRQTLDKVRSFAVTRAQARSGKLDRVTGSQAVAAGRSYSAVSIRPGLMACDHVMSFAGRRMLEKDAPVLPVPGCSEGSCSCRYVKHADRRSGEERRLPFSSGQHSGGLGAEKRESSDRRAQRARPMPRAYFNNYD